MKYYMPSHKWHLRFVATDSIWSRQFCVLVDICHGSAHSGAIGKFRKMLIQFDPVIILPIYRKISHGCVVYSTPIWDLYWKNTTGLMHGRNYRCENLLLKGQWWEMASYWPLSNWQKKTSILMSAVWHQLKALHFPKALQVRPAMRTGVEPITQAWPRTKSMPLHHF